MTKFIDQNNLLRQLQSVDDRLRLLEKTISPIEARRYVGEEGQPAFLTTWTNYGLGYAPACFYKDPFGRVHLEGLVKSSETPISTIFTLPVGYRPTEKLIVVNYAAGGACRIDIEADGDVRLNAGGVSYTSLSGISFRIIDS